MADPKPTREYLQGLTKRVADVYEATVTERHPRNVYVVKRIDSGAHRWAKGQQGDVHAIKSRVRCESSSASGNAIGSMDTILSRAPQRGLSETTPAVRTETTTAEPIVFTISPQPLVLEAGGYPGEQVIFGRNFTDGGEYVGFGDGTDPEVTDEDAPVITSTKVTRNISADADSPTGTFDLMIGGRRLRKVLEITAPTTFPLVNSLWATVDQTLYMLDPDTLAEIFSYDLAALPVSGLGTVGGISRIGDMIVIPVNSGLGHRLVIVDMTTRTASSVASGWVGTFPPLYLAPDGDHVWYRDTGGANARTIEIDGSGDAHAVPAGATPGAGAVSLGVGALWLGAENGRLMRMDTTTFATLHSVVGTDAARIVVHAGSVYVLDADDGTVYQRETSGGTAVANLQLPTTHRLFGRQIVSAGGKLFVTALRASNNELGVFRFEDDLSAFTLVATVANPGTFDFAFAAGSPDALYFTTGGTPDVYRVDAATYAVTSATLGGSFSDKVFYFGA